MIFFISRYAPDEWSVYTSTMNGTPRTNNAQESFHAKFNVSLYFIKYNTMIISSNEAVQFTSRNMHCEVLGYCS